MCLSWQTGEGIFTIRTHIDKLECDVAFFVMFCYAGAKARGVSCGIFKAFAAEELCDKLGKGK